MATQGIVSVVRGGAVLLKVVAGSDGYNAPKLAEALRAWFEANEFLYATDDERMDARTAYCLASMIGFGADCDRVVVMPDEVFHQCDDELGPLYRQTFADPRFNPRWEYGTADYIEVVDLDAKEVL